MDAKFDFGPEAGQRIVYVLPVAVTSLPDEVRAQLPGLDTLYAVHGADGERLATVADGRQVSAATIAVQEIRRQARGPLDPHDVPSLRVTPSSRCRDGVFSPESGRSLSRRALPINSGGIRITT